MAKKTKAEKEGMDIKVDSQGYKYMTTEQGTKWMNPLTNRWCLEGSAVHKKMLKARELKEKMGETFEVVPEVPVLKKGPTKVKGRDPKAELEAVKEELKMLKAVKSAPKPKSKTGSEFAERMRLAREAAKARREKGNVDPTGQRAIASAETSTPKKKATKKVVESSSSSEEDEEDTSSDSFTSSESESERSQSDSQGSSSSDIDLVKVIAKSVKRK